MSKYLSKKTIIARTLTSYKCKYTTFFNTQTNFFELFSKSASIFTNGCTKSITNTKSLSYVVNRI